MEQNNLMYLIYYLMNIIIFRDNDFFARIAFSTDVVTLFRLSHWQRSMPEFSRRNDFLPKFFSDTLK